MIEERTVACMLRPNSWPYEENLSRPCDYLLANLNNLGNTSKGNGKLVQIASTRNEAFIPKAAFLNVFMASVKVLCRLKLFDCC